jgi:hypothetical protein
MALSRLQKITGSIGLDISVEKTEWLYLHNPDSEEVEQCRRKRSAGGGHCCEQVVLDEQCVRHTGSFRYLGSMISEDGGVELETAVRIRAAVVALNRLACVS